MFTKSLRYTFVLVFLTLSSLGHAAGRGGSMQSRTTYSISPALTFLGPLVGPSINSYVGIAPSQDPNLFIGADLGIEFYFPSGLLLNLQILPAVWYEFALPNSPQIKLVAGVEFGPAILIGTGSGGVVSGATYEFLVRPGILAKMSESQLMGLDLKFGVLGGAFVFKPQFNFIFPL